MTAVASLPTILGHACSEHTVQQAVYSAVVCNLAKRKDHVIWMWLKNQLKKKTATEIFATNLPILNSQFR